MAASAATGTVKVKPRAPPRPLALGPDAPAVGLDQPLADGEAEAAPGPALPVGGIVGGIDGGVLAEQVRQAVRRDARAFVGDRERDVHAVAFRPDADGGRSPGMGGGVREQVVQHLHDAPPVGHHPGQVGRQVDADGVQVAAVEEGVARPVHQAGHLRGLGRDRERARVDPPGIEQVADEAAHVIGLLVDDPEERAHLRRVELRRRGQQGGGRALDGGERCAQLVAHHAQELGADALELAQRRQVLHGDHHRRDRAVSGEDRRRVDERRDAPAVGKRELDFLRPHRFAQAQRLGQRQLVERDLAPVGAPAGEHLQQRVGEAPRHAQALHDPLRFAIDRDQAAAPPVEDQDADRRGVDQGLEVGARAVLGLVGARVGDRRRSLRGEQHQHLLVLARKLFPALLLGEEETADLHAAMAHGRALEGSRRHQVRGEAERADIGRHVGEPERPRQVAQVQEQRRPVGPGRQPAVLGIAEAGGDEVAGLPCLVDGHDDAVACAGQRTRAFRHLMQDGAEVEAGADTQDRGTQAGLAPAQPLVLTPQLRRSAHRLIRPVARALPGSGRSRSGSPPD